MFLGLENKSVRRNGWNPFIKYLEDSGLDKYFKIHNNEMIAYSTLMKNVEIHFQGADHVKVVEGLRGPNYHYIVVDEAGSFRNEILENLVYESAGPGLTSVQGELELQGTPPPIPNTFFEEAFKETSGYWRPYYWTFRDNDHVANNILEELEVLKETRGWDDDNPIFRREYLGEFVYDTSRLLIKLDREKNVGAVPTGTYKYYIGVDFGWSDSNAFIILGENQDNGKVYVVEHYKESNVTPTDFGVVIKDALNRYNIPFGRTAADYGGLGRAVLEDFRQHHGINLQDATKRGKGMAVSMLNEALVTDKLVIGDNNWPLVKELAELERNPKKPDQPRDGQEDHLFDALLYVLRLTNAFKPQETEAPKQTQEQLFREQIRQQDLRQSQKEEDPFGINDYNQNDGGFNDFM